MILNYRMLRYDAEQVNMVWIRDRCPSEFPCVPGSAFKTVVNHFTRLVEIW